VSAVNGDEGLLYVPAALPPMKEPPDLLPFPPQVLLDSRLDGPQRQSGSGDEKYVPTRVCVKVWSHQIIH